MLIFICLIVQNTEGLVVPNTAIELEAEDTNDGLFNITVKTYSLTWFKLKKM